MAMRFRARIGVVVVVVGLVGCGLDPAVDRAAIVVRDPRDGRDVLRDEALREWLGGDLVLGEEPVAVAACHSLLGHAGDWAVGSALVVATRPDLVRVAEMVAGGVVEVEDAVLIESLLFAVPGSSFDAAVLAGRTGVPVSRVRHYLEERALDPSAAALERFAVYAQNERLSTQRLVFVDGDGLAGVDFGGMAPGYSSVDFQVAGDAELLTLHKSDCDRILTEPGTQS